MIYLTDTLPKFCPACGQAHSTAWFDANRTPFYSGASGACDCGAMYQHLPSPALIEASKLNPAGDLHQYV